MNVGMKLNLFSSFLVLVAILSAGVSASAEPTETVVYSFAGGVDGAQPEVGLAVDAVGTFFGTTLRGGGNSCLDGCGTIFKLVPPGNATASWTETVIFRFPHFMAPSAVTLGKRGELYGTTALGGNLETCSRNGCGTVFKLSPPREGKASWTFTVLYRFQGEGDGSNPTSGVILADDGTLFGTTTNTVFKLAPPARGTTSWQMTVLHTFKQNDDGNGDGSYVMGRLAIGANGTLYGSTVLGGKNNCSPSSGGNIGCGTIFKLTPPSNGESDWTETILYNFSKGPGGHGPHSSVAIDQTGALYGVADWGGLENSVRKDWGNGCGTVFKLVPPTGSVSEWNEEVTYQFTGGEDGCQPKATPLIDKNGTIYGTAFGDGTTLGMVYRLDPPTTVDGAWRKTVLHAFTGAPFELPPGNGLRTQRLNHNFKGRPDGATVWSGVVEGKDGALYGTTMNGASPNCDRGCGVVYRVSR